MDLLTYWIEMKKNEQKLKPKLRPLLRGPPKAPKAPKKDIMKSNRPVGLFNI
jgi:hypothetical protein